MRPAKKQDDLQRTLECIDGRAYKAYQDLKGSYDFERFTLSVDHVQGDPFAAPSRLRVHLDPQTASFPQSLSSSPIRAIALGDFLSRAFDKNIRDIVRGQRGSGRSGLFHIDSGGQEVLERTSVLCRPDRLQARFTMGLPAQGRRVLARQAQEMFFSELPQIVQRSLLYRHLSASDLEQHVDAVEDQQVLRESLKEHGLIGFVANDSLLPRLSGADNRPLSLDPEARVVPFRTPPELQVKLPRPNGPPLSGMGIPRGVTLIVGGGFHGKSTLLRALERGVYNHLPGDGREWTVTLESAVKIRAEDGRSVKRVDISPFISNLPFDPDTTAFSTDNASGSTSQAANIMEALEMGAEALLIDEDTSATNFIIRDARMQKLVAKSKETITPFVDRVRQLSKEHGTSTILVMGGSGDYFEVADHVIMLDEYRPRYVTSQARSIMRELPNHRQAEGGASFGEVIPRLPEASSFDPRRGRREVKIEAKGLEHILYGTTPLDLSALEQLIDVSQTRAVGKAIHYYAQHYTHGLSLRQGLTQLMADLDRQGLDALTQHPVGNLARPRIFEIAFAINRLRSLRVRAD